MKQFSLSHPAYFDVGQYYIDTGVQGLDTFCARALAIANAPDIRFMGLYVAVTGSYVIVDNMSYAMNKALIGWVIAWDKDRRSVHPIRICLNDRPDHKASIMFSRQLPHTKWKL